MASFRSQFTLPDELVRAIAAKLGDSTFTEYTYDQFEELKKTDKKAASEMEKVIRDFVYSALEMFAKSEGTVPASAIVLDSENTYQYFDGYSTAKDEDSKMSPAEALANRFRTKVGAPIRLTELQLVEEAVRAKKEMGRSTTTVGDIVHNALAGYCQRVVSDILRKDYGRERDKRRQFDFSYLNKAHAVLAASLQGHKSLRWVDPITGEVDEVKVPAWYEDDDGYGYHFTYKVITVSYIAKATSLPPINRPTNMIRVREWIEYQQVVGIVDKVKGKSREES